MIYFKLTTFIFFLFLTNSYSQLTCDISINEGGSIKTHNNSQMGIYGNLNNEGDFTENGGQVGFYNEDNSLTISGENAPEISELIVDVPNDLNLEVNTIVNLGLQFSQGRIVTPRETTQISLDLNETDLYLFEDDSKHVDGYTSYTGENAYTFPIGDDLRLREISIEANASVNTTKAAYFYENPNTPSTFSSFDLNEMEETIRIVSPLEFWDLDGDTATKATLSWDIMSNIGQLVNNNDLSELRVVGWSIEENMWLDLGGTNTTGNITSGSTESISFIPNDCEIITFGGLNKGVLSVSSGLTVLNAISADGNNDNSYLRIIGINEFPNNNLKIFNRWGVKVFEADNYTEPNPKLGDELDDNRVFMGKSNGRATIKANEKLPTGTYFYILNYENNGQDESKAGYLYLQN